MTGLTRHQPTTNQRGDDMTTDKSAAPERHNCEIAMTYRNWRGEVSQRTIRPVGLWFGQTNWHPEPGWLLNAWDCDKGERRDFALADCQFALLDTPTSAEPAGDVLREAVEAFEHLVVCRCDPAYTDRDLHAPDCNRHYATDLDVIRSALAAAPAPAPQPVADREALVEVIRDADIEWSRGWNHVKESLYVTIADALLARGLRLPTDEGEAE